MIFFKRVRSWRDDSVVIKCTALIEDLGLVSSTHVGWLKSCNFRDLIPSAHTYIHILSLRYRILKINDLNIFLKRLKRVNYFF